MKISISSLSLVFALAFLNLGYAQNSKSLVIQNIQGNTVPTPQYGVRAKGEGTSNVGRKDWYEVKVEYATAPKWMDQLVLTFFVLMKSSEGKAKAAAVKPFHLLRQEVVYAHIPKGSHKATVYIHPHMFKRYGKVEGIAVAARSGGVVLEVASRPKVQANQSPWWERQNPKMDIVDGMLLKRSQTPFAFVNPDDYEMVRPGP